METTFKRPAAATLTQMAERKVFNEVSTLIKVESSKSIFAIGGSIPITALDSRFICESDETLSEDEIDNVQTSQFPKIKAEAVPSVDGFRIDDNVPQVDSKLKDAIHRMRCDPITIRWDSSVAPNVSHKVMFPCGDAERPSFEQLLKDCQPATFGRGGEDVLDESYRKAGKLDESAFCTNFNPHSLGIINTFGQALAPDSWQQTNETHGIRAEMYKLNVCASLLSHNSRLACFELSQFSTGLFCAFRQIQTTRRYSTLQAPDCVSRGLPTQCSQRRPTDPPP